MPENGNIFFTSSDAMVLFHHDDARIGKDLDATGETKEVTIMFSDLRGFTPLSERLMPEEVIGEPIAKE